MTVGDLRKLLEHAPGDVPVRIKVQSPIDGLWREVEISSIMGSTRTAVPLRLVAAPAVTS